MTSELTEHIAWLRKHVKRRALAAQGGQYADFPWMRLHRDTWGAPPPAVIRAVIEAAGLSSQEVARLVGISDGRQVRAWKSGKSKIAYATWFFLLSHLGIISTEH